jgi:hypothetical protein
MFLKEYALKHACVNLFCLQAVSKEAMMRRCGGGTQLNDFGLVGRVSVPDAGTASASPPVVSRDPSFSSDAGSSQSPSQIVPLSKVM